MPDNQRFDLITIGNYTKDTIVTRSGTRHVHGGGFNYAARAAPGRRRYEARHVFSVPSVMAS